MELLSALLFSSPVVYREELHAPAKRHKEEAKPRPLRVGDTDKPEPERK